MNIPRRQFLRLATGAAVVPAFLRSAQARPYPSRPVRIVFGFAAGSAGDIVLTDRIADLFLPGRGDSDTADDHAAASPRDFDGVT